MPNLAQAAKLELFVAVTGEEKGTIITSHSTCSKAPFGSHIKCYNKLRRIGEHQNIQEESMNLEGGKSAKSGPGSQIGAVCFCDREKKATPFLQYMLKGSIWVPYTDVTTSLEELGGIKTYRRSKHTWKVAKVPNLAQAAKLELFVAVKGRLGRWQKCQIWPRQPNRSCLFL